MQQSLPVSGAHTLLREDVNVMIPSPPHLSQKSTATLISTIKHIKAKWHPLQYSAGFFVLEGIV